MGSENLLQVTSEVAGGVKRAKEAQFPKLEIALLMWFQQVHFWDFNLQFDETLGVCYIVFEHSRPTQINNYLDLQLGNDRHEKDQAFEIWPIVKLLGFYPLIDILKVIPTFYVKSSIAKYPKLAWWIWPLFRFFPNYIFTFCVALNAITIKPSLWLSFFVSMLWVGK